MFNGEIYNYRELHNILMTTSATKSDSVCLIQLIQTLGIERTLSKLDGMYSFALFNSIEQSIILCRDPFGEKPLYYYTEDDVLVFSSSQRPISKFFNLAINQSSIQDFLLHGYVDDNNLSYSNLKSVSPNSYIKFSLHQGQIISSFCSHPKYYSDSYTHPASILSNRLDQCLSADTSVALPFPAALIPQH